MSNMTYCRFQNTNLDVQDCMEALTNLADLREEMDWLQDHETAASEDELDDMRAELQSSMISTMEARSAKRMIASFLETMDRLGIIDGWDYAKAEEIIDSFTE